MTAAVDGRGTADLAADVRAMLASADPAGRRLRHVEAVVATARAIAADGGWPDATVAAAERSAWYHDALKLDGPAAWREWIRRAGEEADPWAVAHDSGLLHAQAAAVWAAGRGERDAEVLAAVRHHPTGHPDWKAVGRILFVADFCEPTRDHADDLDTASLLRLARAGPAGLDTAARRVLAIRLRVMIAGQRAVHPDGWHAWNAWTARRA